VIKLNKTILLAAALLCATLGFTGCGGGGTTNTTTNSGNNVVTNANKPANTTTAPANNTSTTSTTTTTGDKIGVAECDEYIEKLEACLTSAPEASRSMVKTNLDTMRKQWKDAASTTQGKAGLATGCKAALDTAKQTYSYCKW
jgi:hypothetical protein